MSLKTKQIAHNYQEERVAHWQDKFAEIIGGEVTTTINVESLVIESFEDMGTAEINTAIEQVHFVPMENALTQLCEDDFAKSAIASNLQVINIQGDYKNGSSLGEYSMQDGVLSVTNRPYTNMDDVDDRTSRIVDAINSAL